MQEDTTGTSNHQPTPEQLELARIRKSAIEELTDWRALGHCQVKPGNEIFSVTKSQDFSTNPPVTRRGSV